MVPKLATSPDAIDAAIATAWADWVASSPFSRAQAAAAASVPHKAVG